MRRFDGALIATALTAAWRAEPPGLDRALLEAAPDLIAWGAGALGWNRLRRSPELAITPSAAQLRDASRLAAIEETLGLLALKAIEAALGEAGVRAVLIKGRAAQAAYGAPCLRPWGDFDLVVAPEQAEAARAALARVARRRSQDVHVFSVKGRNWDIDLHPGLPAWYRIDLGELFRRAIPLPDAPGLSMPAPEEHLRILALHLLKHGGARPIWLVDVAAMTEAVGAEFDWARCLTDEPVTREWLLAVVGAAAGLLGAQVRLPAGLSAPAHPWIMRTLVRAWRYPDARRKEALPRLALRDPAAWLRTRWPNALQAAFALRRRPSRATGWNAQAWSFASGPMRDGFAHLASPDWWRG